MGTSKPADISDADDSVLRSEGLSFVRTVITSGGPVHCYQGRHGSPIVLLCRALPAPWGLMWTFPASPEMHVVWATDLDTVIWMYEVVLA